MGVILANLAFIGVSASMSEEASWTGAGAFRLSQAWY